MKLKISVSLSKEILEAIKKRAKGFKSASEFIEVAVRAQITILVRDEQNATDFKILNRKAHHLNDEAKQVIEYQRIPKIRVKKSRP